MVDEEMLLVGPAPRNIILATSVYGRLKCDIVTETLFERFNTAATTTTTTVILLWNLR